VLGFDVSQVAVEVAATAAHEYLGPGRYEYRRGSFSATGLPDQCADAVVAVEALPMAAAWGKPGLIGVQFTVQRPAGAGSVVDGVSLRKAERRCNGLIVEPATLGLLAFRLRAPP